MKRNADSRGDINTTEEDMKQNPQPPKYQPPTGAELIFSVALFVVLMIWNWL